MQQTSFQRNIAIAGLATFAFLLIASLAFMWRVRTVLLNSATVNQSWEEEDVFYESTRHAMRIGGKQQRLAILNHLADQGPQAWRFAGDVREAIEDDDQDIASAAKSALEKISSRGQP